MSLRALRDELKSLIASTEDAGAKLAELDAKARPYTLNPNGSVTLLRKPSGVITSDVSCAFDRPGHGLALRSAKHGVGEFGARNSHSNSLSMPSLPALHPQQRSAHTAALPCASAPRSEAQPRRLGAVSAGGEQPLFAAAEASHFGSAPTNRWEAVQLSRTLEERLAAAGGSFEKRLEAHEFAFDELVRQVGVHCAERGEVLASMRGFYSGYAAAFASVTRKRQQDAGLVDLDSKLDAMAATHKRLAARASKLDARLKSLEAVLTAGDKETAKLLLLVASSDVSASGGSLGVDDLALSTVGRQIAAVAKPGLRAEMLLSLVKGLSKPDRQGAVSLLIALMPPDEQLSVLQGAVHELDPSTRAKSLGTIMNQLSPSEQLELIANLAQGFQHAELVALLKMPLSRLPKERTLEVMEVLLQLSPAVSAALSRVYGRMTEMQKQQMLHLIAAKMGPAEIAQLKSELKLESSAAIARLESELKRAQAESAALTAVIEREREALKLGAAVATASRSHRPSASELNGEAGADARLTGRGGAGGPEASGSAALARLWAESPLDPEAAAGEAGSASTFEEPPAERRVSGGLVSTTATVTQSSIVEFSLPLPLATLLPGESGGFSSYREPPASVPSAPPSNGDL